MNSEKGAEILIPPQNGDHFLNYFLADDQYCIYVLFRSSFAKDNKLRDHLTPNSDLPMALIRGKIIQI